MDGNAWSACPEELPGVVEGTRCLSVRVPWLWGEPDGARIDVMVVRYPAESGQGLLDGGPGGTGAGDTRARPDETLAF
jgi:hypothetical protein